MPSRKLAWSSSGPMAGFCCGVDKGADRNLRASLEIAREGAGSTIRGWVVHHDCITEHDRRHALLRGYLESSHPDNRKVAEAIRPVLEAFIRVSYPEHFPPGAMLGQFIDICRQRVGKANEVLDRARTQELGNLLEYANKFHHDTNMAWETEVVNDGLLVEFVKRTLAFPRH